MRIFALEAILLVVVRSKRPVKVLSKRVSVVVVCDGPVKEVSVY